jgi:O-antigen ligase
MPVRGDGILFRIGKDGGGLFANGPPSAPMRPAVPARPARAGSWAATAAVFGTAAVIGCLSAQDPLAAAALTGAASVAAVALLAPFWAAAAILASTAVSVQIVFPETAVLGFELLALQKLAMLALMMPVMLRYGIVRHRLLPVMALAASFAVTWLWGEPVLSVADSGKAFLGLAAPLAILAVRWPQRIAGRLIRMVMALPAICLIAGIALQAAGLHEVVMQEFTGVPRLQGASIPAHLAFLAFTGFAASVLEWKRKPPRQAPVFAMMGVNFLILLLTGTRGPLVASVPLVLVFLADLARQFARGRSGLAVPLVGIAGLIGLSVLWQWDQLMKRSFFRSSSAGIDLSGREEAWRFFIERARESPWFGKGLGSVLLANDGTLYEGFAVPHNEYIRFFYDAGITGAALLFAALLAVLLAASRSAPSGGRAHWFALVAGFLLYSASDNTLSTLQFTVPFCALAGAYSIRPGSGRPGGKEAVHA